MAILDRTYAGYVVVTSPTYTIDLQKHSGFLFCINTSAQDVTVNLPETAPILSTCYIVKTSDDANKVIINPLAGSLHSRKRGDGVAANYLTLMGSICQIWLYPDNAIPTSIIKPAWGLHGQVL